MRAAADTGVGTARVGERVSGRRSAANLSNESSEWG